MRLDDYTLVPGLGKDFNGTYSRGIDDTVPLDHAIDANDIIFEPGQFGARPGCSRLISLPDASSIIRWYTWNRIDHADEIVYLDNTGKIWRTGNAGTPIFNNASCTDFSMFSCFNKLFIAPHDGTKGLTGTNLQVFTAIAGSSTATITRDIGSEQEDNLAVDLTIPTGGTVNVGVHKLALVFVTDTGHLHADPLVQLTGSFNALITLENNQASNNIFVSAPYPPNNVVDGDTITVNGKVYTFKTTLTPTEGQIKIGSNIAISLTNFTSAINGVGAPGFDYSVATYNPDVSAAFNYPNLLLVARSHGTSGNSLTLTSVITAGNLVITNPTFYGGYDGKKIIITINTFPGSNLETRIKQIYIIATKADENEFFFVPGAIINNDNANVPYFNNGNHSITLDFLDTDLVQSADYLFDQESTIPTGSGINLFSGRLLVYGFPSPDASLIRASRSNANILFPDLESFDATSGFILVNRDDGDGVFNTCFLNLQILYIFKNTGTFATLDSGDVPSSWIVRPIDNTHGCFVHCIDNFAAGNQTKQSLNATRIATIQGIYNFNGNYPEIPLTWKEESLWHSINPAYFYKTQLAEDTQNKFIFALIVTGTATDYNTLLVGDYSNGLDTSKIVWNKFNFFKQPSSIGIYNSNDAPYTFAFTSKDATGTVKQLWGWNKDVKTYYADDNNNSAISPSYQFAWGQLDSSKINLFPAIRIKGSQAYSGFTPSLVVSAFKEGDTSATTLFTVGLPTPNIDILKRFIPAQSEKYSIVIKPNNLIIYKMELYAKIIAQMRPS